MTDSNANSENHITASGASTRVFGNDPIHYTNNSTGVDTVTVGYGGNTIEVNDGANTVVAGYGNNIITGGDGVDTVTVGYGSNTIDVGNGANTITASDILGSVNTITGGTGVDTVTVGAGSNTIDVGDGANTIAAGDGSNVIIGGTGVDTITVGAGNNKIDAGDGANTITAGAGSNVIIGGTGVDTITAMGASLEKNYIEVEGGANTILTGASDDYIKTGNSVDTVNTGAGDDYIKVNGGVDTIEGGTNTGEDTIDMTGIVGLKDNGDIDHTTYSINHTVGSDQNGQITGVGGSMTFSGVENIITSTHAVNTNSTAVDVNVYEFNANPSANPDGEFKAASSLSFSVAAGAGDTITEADSTIEVGVVSSGSFDSSFASTSLTQTYSLIGEDADQFEFGTGLYSGVLSFKGTNNQPSFDADDIFEFSVVISDSTADVTYMQDFQVDFLA